MNKQLITSVSVVALGVVLSRCEGIRTTAWGTVLATEETGDELRPGSYEDSNGSEDTDGGAIAQEWSETAMTLKLVDFYTEVRNGS